MNYKNEIIFDRENNVKIMVKQESVLFIFLPSYNQKKYECVEIDKDNTFTLDDLFNLWKIKKYPYHMLEIINKVSLNLLASEFNYAYHFLPSSVVEQSDINAEFAKFQAAKFGGNLEPYENLRKISKEFKRYCEKESYIKSEIATEALKIYMPMSQNPHEHYILYLRNNENNFAHVNHLPENVLQFIDRQPFKYLHSTYYNENVQN